MLKRISLTILTAALLFGLVWLVSGGNPIDYLFKPSSVRRVENPQADVEASTKEIDRLEKQIADNVDTADRVAETQARLGAAYLKHRNWDKAIESFTKALAGGADTPENQYQLGLALANRAQTTQNRDDFEQAARHYREALRKNPEYQDPAYGLALVQYYGLQRKADGLKSIDSLCSKNPSFLNARFAQARMYYENSDAAKSLTLYQKLYEDIQRLPGGAERDEYSKAALTNIERLTAELGRN